MIVPSTRLFRLSTLALVATVAACSPAGVKAPREPGACWHMVTRDDGTTRFNPMGKNVSDLEHCAARLERMRQSFLAVGGGRSEVIGAYQGRFLFLDRNSIRTSKSLNGNRYVALVRTGDGRLVVPGAMRPVRE